MIQEPTLAVPIPPNGKVDAETVYSHSVGQHRILQLKSQDPFTKKLFPAFVDRCQKFIEVTASDSDPIWLGSLLYNNFYQATNYIHCLVALSEKDEIRAHAFSYLENSYRFGLHVHVLQIWKDEGTGLLEAGLPLIEEYARDNKCKTIIYSADSLAKLRLYGKYGFELHRVLGKKELT